MKSVGLYRKATPWTTAFYDERPLAPDELTSDVIDKAMSVLQQQFGHEYAGLQPTVLGQCVKNRSLPKFTPAGQRRFVQVTDGPNRQPL